MSSDYLKQPKVMQFLDALVSQLVQHEPADPRRFAAEWLVWSKGCEAPQQVQRPTVAPVPPPSEPSMQDSLRWLVDELEHVAEEHRLANSSAPPNASHPLMVRGEAALRRLAIATPMSERDVEPNTAARRTAAALYEAAQTMQHRNLDFPEVISRIVIASQKLISADRCSVFLVNEQRKTLHTTIEGKTFTLRFGQGIVGHVARTGCSLCVPDAYEDKRFDPRIDRELHYRTDNILCLPVEVDQKLVAVVELVNKRGGPFTDDDEALFASFATFAGLAIRHVSVYKEQERLALRNAKMVEVAEALANAALVESELIPTIVKHAKAIVGADRCAFFAVDDEQRILRAHMEGMQTQIELPLDSGVVGWCAKSACNLNIPDAYSDSRFNKEVDAMSGYRTHSILCIPIFVGGKVVAVSQLVNKLGQGNAATEFVSFTEDDEGVLAGFASIAGACMRNCRMFDVLQRRQQLTETTLSMAKALVESSIIEVDAVVVSIANSVQKYTQTEQCVIFALEEASRTFSAADPHNPNKRIHIPLGHGIIGAAAKTGKLSVLKAPLPRGSEQYFAVTVREVLIMPVCVGGTVSAVIAVANKTTQESFMQEDIEAVELFSLFAGMALRNARLFEASRNQYEEQQHLMELERTATEREIQSSSSDPSLSVVAANATQIGTVTVIPVEEITAALQTPIEQELRDTLSQHGFNVHLLKDDVFDSVQTIPLVVEMFQRLHLLETFEIEPANLARFTMMVRGRYRQVPYHNFFHAFDVTQTLFAMISSAQLQDVLEPLELLMLLLSGLVHDVDHMGLNNAFHLKAQTPMGILTSLTGNKSVLEVHHCQIAIEFLSQVSLLQHLPKADLARAYKILIDNVLATDMSLHKELLAQFTTELASGVTKASSESRRSAMLMLLKAADISNITKDFDISRKWGICVMEEFYRQGDVERKVGVDVTPMFDREKKVELAKGQIDFINFVGKPYFDVVRKCFPQLSYMREGLDANLVEWQRHLERRNSDLGLSQIVLKPK